MRGAFLVMSIIILLSSLKSKADDDFDSGLFKEPESQYSNANAASATPEFAPDISTYTYYDPDYNIPGYGDVTATSFGSEFEMGFEAQTTISTDVDVRRVKQTWVYWVYEEGDGGELVQISAGNPAGTTTEFSNWADDSSGAAYKDTDAEQAGDWVFSIDCPGRTVNVPSTAGYIAGDKYRWCLRFIEWVEDEDGDGNPFTSSDNRSPLLYWNYTYQATMANDPNHPGQLFFEEDWHESSSGSSTDSLQPYPEGATP